MLQTLPAGSLRKRLLEWSSIFTLKMCGQTTDRSLQASASCRGNQGRAYSCGKGGLYTPNSDAGGPEFKERDQFGVSGNPSQVRGMANADYVRLSNLKIALKESAFLNHSLTVT